MIQVSGPLLAAVNSVENQPIDLYELYLDSTVLLYADQDITWGGNHYLPKVKSRSAIKRYMNGQFDGVSVTFSNVDLSIASALLNNEIEGRRLVIRKIDRSVAADSIVLFDGRLDPLAHINETEVTISAKEILGSIDFDAPARKFGETCGWDFKGLECGYAGAETVCDKSWARCNQLANTPKYGGFRFLPHSGTFQYKDVEVKRFLLIFRRKKAKLVSVAYNSVDDTPYDLPIPLIYGRVMIAGIVIQHEDQGAVTKALVAFGTGKVRNFFYLRANESAVTDHTDHFGAPGGGSDQGIDPRFPSSYQYSHLAYAGISIPSDVHAVDSAPAVTAVVQGLQVPLFDATGAFTHDDWSDNPVWNTRDYITRPLATGGMGIPEGLLDDVVNFQTAQYCDQLINDATNDQKIYNPTNLPDGIDYRRYRSTGVYGSDPTVDGPYFEYEPGIDDDTSTAPTVVQVKRFTMNAAIAKEEKAIDILYKKLLASFRGYLTQSASGKLQIRCERPVKNSTVTTGVAAGVQTIACSNPSQWAVGDLVLASPFTANAEVLTVDVVNVGSLHFATATLHAHAAADVLMQVAMAFHDGNIVGGFEYPLADQQSSTNRITIKYADAPAGFQEKELHINDYTHQNAVHKVNNEDADGGAIDSFNQAWRIGQWLRAKRRDLGKFCTFRADIKATLLEIGDVIAVSATEGGLQAVPFMATEVSYEENDEVGIVAQLYSLDTYSDTAPQVTVTVPTIFNAPVPADAPQVSGFAAGPILYTDARGTFGTANANPQAQTHFTVGGSFNLPADCTHLSAVEAYVEWIQAFIGTWNAGTDYSSNSSQHVLFSDRYYRDNPFGNGNLNHQPNTSPGWWTAQAAPAWDSGTTYTAGQFVTYGGQRYASNGTNTNQQPDISPGWWPVVAAWSAVTNYAVNTVVQYGGTVYKYAPGANIGYQPDVSPWYWTFVTPNIRTLHKVVAPFTSANGLAPSSNVTFRSTPEERPQFNTLVLRPKCRSFNENGLATLPVLTAADLTVAAMGNTGPQPTAASSAVLSEPYTTTPGDLRTIDPSDQTAHLKVQAVVKTSMAGNATYFEAWLTPEFGSPTGFDDIGRFDVNTAVNDGTNYITTVSIPRWVPNNDSTWVLKVATGNAAFDAQFSNATASAGVVIAGLQAPLAGDITGLGLDARSNPPKNWNDVVLEQTEAGAWYWGLPDGVHFTFAGSDAHGWRSVLTAQAVDASGNPAPADQGGTESLVHYDAYIPGKTITHKDLDWWEFNPPGSIYDHMLLRAYMENRNLVRVLATSLDVHFGQPPAGALDAARVNPSTWGMGIVPDPVSLKPVFDAGNLANLVLNPGFEYGKKDWEDNGAPFVLVTSPSAAYTGQNYAKLTGQYSGAMIRYISVRPGDKFYAEAYVKPDGTVNGSASIYIDSIDSSGAYLSATSSASPIAPSVTVWTKLTHTYTVPAGASFLRIIFCWLPGTTNSGYWFLDNCFATKIWSAAEISAGIGLGADGSGNLVVKTGSGLGDDGTNVIIPTGGVGTSHLAAGSLGDFSKYSSSVRAIGIVFGLPSLPQSSYPQGAIIFNTADSKLYRNTTGSAWSASASPADLIAGTIAAGVAYVGTINASQVNAGTFNGFAFTGSTLVLNLNGITTSINNGFDSGSGFNAGMKVLNNSNSQYVVVSDGGFYVFDGSGVARAQLSRSGAGGYFGLSNSTYGTSFSINLNTGSPTVYINGTQVLSTRYGSTPVTLADAIAVMQHHGLCP